MEIPSIVDEIIEWIPSIDYNSSSTELSVFETTIRYLAGMLSGYDLLTGPLSHVASNKSAVESLLSQSINLADDLKYAFETPTGIPHHSLFETKHTYDSPSDNSIASVGTLQIEWQHLSDLTGNPEYGNLVQKAESYLLNPKTEIWPGLIPTHIDIYNGEFTDLYGGWSGAQDSFYEYLIKMYVYDSSRYGNYSDRWIVAADSTMKHLAAHPPKKPELTFISGYYNQTLDHSSHHLTCFDGGNFILGGQVFNRTDYLDFGLQLVDSCHWTYNTTATKLGPEDFSWNPHRVPKSQRAFYEKNGYFIKNGMYDLRPEVIESYYYAYKATGNEMYRDWAWEAFIAINETCRAGNGFTAITNVNAPGGGNTRNEQESFLFAEVLKYSYMIQKPVSLTSDCGLCRGICIGHADNCLVSSMGFRPQWQKPLRI